MSKLRFDERQGFRDEAYEHFHRRRTGLPELIGYGLGKLLLKTISLAWAIRITIAWILLVVVWANNSVWGWAALCLSLVPPLVLNLQRTGLYALPELVVRVLVIMSFMSFIFADVNRAVFKYQARKEARKGAEFLVNAGIINHDLFEEVQDRVTLKDDNNTAVLRIEKPIAGVSAQDISNKSRTFKQLLNATRTTLNELGPGCVEVIFYRNDPLNEAMPREHLGHLDADKMTVSCAIDEYGKPVSITFGDHAGGVIGGIPGSGKTAGATSFLLPLALSEYVNLSIIDGKGGQDWESYKPAASTFLRTQDGLEAVRDFLRDKNQERMNRVDGMKQMTGNSNFWNVDAETRLQAGLRFELIIIDECQDYFTEAGMSKDDKALVVEIKKHATDLVKLGRSAGMFVLSMTQKPTSESLPTALRDNCGVRISFKVNTAAAEEAILGTRPEDPNTIKATEIPASRKGGAVLTDETGLRIAVRFGYVPEQEQEELIRANASAKNA